jgi:trehalose/maltose transport system substrate-binding protein
VITRRKFVWSVCGVTGAGLLAACGPTAASVSTVTPAIIATVAPVPTAIVDDPPPVRNADAARRLHGQTIAVYSLNMGIRAFTDVSDALGRRFSQDTGIVARIAHYSLSEALPFYQASLEAQSTDLDVLPIDVIWPGILGRYLVDLNPMLGAEAKQHYPAIVQNNTVEGRLTSLPLYADFGMLYYRKDLLQKYGFGTAPRTWEELEQQANRIVEGEKATNPSFTGFVYQGAASEGLTCNMLEWLASSGAGTLVEDGKVTINNPQAAAILNRIRGWTGTISPRNVTTYAEEDARTVFHNGNAAFMRNWPYAYTLASAADSPIKDRFAVGPLPAAPGQKSVGTVGGWEVAVNKYSRAVDAALEWVRYESGPDAQTYRALVLGTVPTIPAVAARPDVLQAEPFLTNLQDVTRVTRPSGIFGERYNQASTAIFRGVNQILNGQDASPVLSDIQSQLKRLLG